MIPGVQHWVDTLCRGSVPAVLDLYTPGAVLIPTFSNQILQGRRALRSYFEEFTQRKGLCGRIDEIIEQGPVVSGIYTFGWYVDGKPVEEQARFTFVFVPDGPKMKICTHHSSAMPETV